MYISGNPLESDEQFWFLIEGKVAGEQQKAVLS
jgi:hypothetical protein